MRTTVTLDEDVAALVRKLMEERGLSFKEAVNEAIRRGLAPRARRAFRTPTFAMGIHRGVPLDRALELAGRLEDEALIAKQAVRK